MMKSHQKKKQALKSVASSRSILLQKKSSAAPRRNPKRPRSDTASLNARDPLKPKQGPELVLALVGPIGTDLNLVAKVLQEELKLVNYTSFFIKVTDLLKDVPLQLDLTERPLEKRYASYIDASNKLRKTLNRQDAMALLSVSAIRTKRAEITGDRQTPAERTAFILSQFKRPEEIETLRRVYGKGLLQISAYCSISNRLDQLTNLIAKSHFRARTNEYYRGSAHQLIVRDDSEEENAYGQRVRDTFPLADVIINAENESTTRETCARFIRVFFGDNFVTPTKDEYGVSAARFASIRSADLSRQVGAAIVNDDGEVIALGCNEVPSAAGGFYWETDSFDARDFRLGYDSSVRVKREILEDIFRRLKERKGWLSTERAEQDVDGLVDEALTTGNSPVLRGAQVTNILEFGRIVHAEMASISNAVRSGTSVRGTVMYTTTFPCHICARHIVAAGIRRLVYLEPYSKSLAAELYPDSINIDGQPKSDSPKVRFEPFVGIAPSRYADVFSKNKRKTEDGQAAKWDPTRADPIIKRFVSAYLNIEQAVAIHLVDLLQQLKRHNLKK